jgi:acyl-CoA synthetase (AMP-forming)/AMP-acid ligase II
MSQGTGTAATGTENAGTGGDRPLSALQGAGGKATSLGILVRSGVLGGGLPHRTVKRLGALAKYGPTLAGAFTAGKARSPKRVAVTDEQRSVTYEQLIERVNRIAAGLAKHGVGPDGPVAMYQRNSVYAVETLVSASRSGADALLLNTFLSPTQVTEVLNRERPAVLVVDSELRPNVVDVPDGTTIVIGDPEGGGHEGELSLDGLAAGTEPDLPVPSRKGRLIVLTSGTTGAPKGAKRGAPKGLGPAASILSRIRFKAPETMVIAPPLFHTWGLAMLQLAPALNGTIVLRRRPDPETILAAVSEHKATSLIVVPVMMQRLLDLPDAVRGAHDTSSLRVVASSSAPIPKDVCTRFQDTFGDVLFNLYGATEVSWATIATPEDLRTLPGTAGKPPYGTKLALLDENNKPVPRGEIGRIFVGNEMQFEGYTNGKDKERANGLMSTGDRGVLDENNLLTVLGRDDDMVIVGGENVYPIEVEELLVAQPEVKEVVVVGVPDDALGSRLAAYVVLRDGASLAEEDVRGLVRGRLAKFSVPRDVVFLEALPRNATGKVVPRLLPSSTGAE